MRIISEIVARAAKKKGKGEELTAVEQQMFDWAVQENERRRNKAMEGVEVIGNISNGVPVYRKHFIDNSKYTGKKLRKMRKEIAKQALKEFPELEGRLVDLWKHDKKEVTDLSRQQLRYMKRKAK